VPRAKIVRDATARYRWEKARAFSNDPDTRAKPVIEQDSDEAPWQITADYERITADPHLAADLGVVAGTEILRRTYWTEGADGRQMVASVSHIPVALIDANPDLLDASNEPWPGGTIHQLSTVGIEVATITDRVTARPPTPAEAAELGAEPGTSLLCIRKTSHDTTGRVVEISEALYAGDRTELVYTIDL
jgi:GntR family transcriptional regulator